MVAKRETENSFAIKFKRDLEENCFRKKWREFEKESS